jgi:hypothetical protein
MYIYSFEVPVPNTKAYPPPKKTWYYRVQRHVVRTSTTDDCKANNSRTRTPGYTGFQYEEASNGAKGIISSVLIRLEDP